MGNRAVITTKDRDLGVYVHWNGGRKDVEAFLEYCRLRNFRTPESDPYGWARLCQVLANVFGADGLSVGISRYTTDKRMNPGDNGTYVIADWRIVDRFPRYLNDVEGSMTDEASLLDRLLWIDGEQPADQQLGREFICAKETPTKDIRVGDVVYVPSYGSKPYERHTVIATDDPGRVVNGHHVSGIPMISRYDDGDGHVLKNNPNNYLLEPAYRVAREG